MRKLLLIALFLLLSATVKADFYAYEFTVYDTIAADSSDSGFSYDTTISPVWEISNWAGIGTNLEIYNIGVGDTNFANDRYIIIWQTSLIGGGQDTLWHTIPGKEATDTINPGTTDTIRYGSKVINGDSVFNFIRAVFVKRDSLSGANAQALAGNSYESNCRIWAMEKRSKERLYQDYLFSFTFVDTLAADSSDSLAKYDTLYTDTVYVGDWEDISTDWDIYDVDTDFTTQYFFVQMQTNRDINGTGTWINVGGASALDTIEAEDTDTTRHTISIVPGDSVWNYVRFRIINKDSLAYQEARDRAGEIYNYHGRIYLMRKK